jgi:hypothetical protein
MSDSAVIACSPELCMYTVLINPIIHSRTRPQATRNNPTSDSSYAVVQSLLDLKENSKEWFLLKISNLNNLNIPRDSATFKQGIKSDRITVLSK